MEKSHERQQLPLANPCNYIYFIYIYKFYSNAQQSVSSASETDVSQVAEADSLHLHGVQPGERLYPSAHLHSLLCARPHPYFHSDVSVSVNISLSLAPVDF